MKTMKFFKGHWSGRWVVAVLCALVLMSTMPQQAEATAVEYAVMLALIIVVCTAAVEVNSNAWGVLGDQIQAAAAGAELANSEGDRPKEISRLGKTIGLAEAMMGLTSSCGDCSEVRSNLQQAIGFATLLKSRALGVRGACNPDGVIRGTEQCDPLAVPTGCALTVEPSFCNDECQCQ